MKHKIAVIGLGYVGLPLVRLFVTKYPIVGFDINEERVTDLNKEHYYTLEVSDELLQAVLIKEHSYKNNLNGLYCSAVTKDMDLSVLREENSVVYDVKGILSSSNCKLKKTKYIL